MNWIRWLSQRNYSLRRPNDTSYKVDINDSTVEPPNNGHIGGRSLVHCREVVPISEVR